jgi:hypothetical protein
VDVNTANRSLHIILLISNKMSNKLKGVQGFDEYYQAVVYAILNDIKNYEVNIRGDKKFYLKKKQRYETPHIKNTSTTTEFNQLDQ